MPRILLLIAVVCAVVILVRRVQTLPPHKRKAGYWQLIIGGAAAAALLLTLMGKMHWVGAALTGLLVVARQLLPVLIRLFPTLHGLWQQRRVSAAQHSEVVSPLLRMTLDHTSGELGGEVIAGPFKDWFLEEMSLTQLQQLLDYCQNHDNDSTQLLLSYLEQRFPEGFATEEAGPANNAAATGMTRTEALAVLGLAADASIEEIEAAHRSLMQKLHPDRGGSDYLAAKLNQAKDVLVEDHSNPTA